MTTTGTTTETFTRTDARFLASRIACELEEVRLLYPHMLSESHMQTLIAEAVELIAHRYLSTIDYGFRKDGVWIFRLRYQVRWDGWVVRNDEAGGIPATIPTEGASFYSYLQYTSSYNALSAEAQEAFESNLAKTLSWRRGGASETPLAAGGSQGSRTFGRSGVSVDRTLFVAS